MYWYPIALPELAQGGYKMGVNTRMMEPGAMKGGKSS